MATVGVLCTADISDCETYRYRLDRSWEGSGKKVAFIGMNPSTADASQDDPTIRRCMNYVRSWGGSHLIMVNLFAHRETDSDKVLKLIKGKDWRELVGGMENQEALDKAYLEADVMIAAWGTKVHDTEPAKTAVANFGDDLYALKQNKDGSPGHPLYLPKKLLPARYQQ